jgi:hypothetical protein
MFSTMLSTRTMIALGFALLIGSPALAGSHKAQVCHVPDGNPANAHEISVSARAVDAHLRNHEGDTLGPCPAPVACPCWTAEELQEATAIALANDSRISCDAGVVSRDPADDELELFADMFFDDGLGDTFVEVDYFRNGPDDVFSECAVGVDGAGVGLEPVEVEDISLEEAAFCRQTIVDVCPMLLP